MRLKRFDYQLPNKNHKKEAIFTIVVCLIAVIAFSSYALYKMTDQKEVTNSKVGEFTKADVTVKVLVDGEKQDAFPAKGTGYIFDSVTCTNGATGTFNKSSWELSVSEIGSPTECTIQFVTGEETEELQYADVSGAEVPELDNGLIPVVYEDNKWKKADTTQKWYDYDTQWWANAVTVKATNRSTYASAAVGTEIPMSAINTMWVWIPRYEYQTDNLGTASARAYAGGTQTEPGAININFISQETTTASASNFLVHPAFTFGTKELSGLWVTKFEMSPAPGTTCATTSNVANCDITTFAPEIKPSAPSWMYARVGTFFTAIQNQMNGSNGNTTYGITNSDTHMMKNMEWGAVAYLSQSKYGKYGNPSYAGANKEVAINNCWYYITGIGGDTVSAGKSTATCTTNTYETAKGQAASTTGNIYGIYDMNGGSSEYVMGVMKDETNTEPMIGNSASYNSGFSGNLYDGTAYEGTYGALKDIDSRYYDLYNLGTSINDFTRYHAGDGTTEVVGWYRDTAAFVGSGFPWFMRGGNYNDGAGAGVFYFNSANGSAVVNLSARAVLVPAAS